MKIAYPRYYREGATAKLTKEEIEKIKQLRNEGWTQQKIADHFEVTIGTIAYHTDPEIKERVKKYAIERFRLNKEDAIERGKKNMKSKRKRQNIEFRIYKSPNAKIRHISNEEFLMIAARKKKMKKNPNSSRGLN